MRRPEVLIPLTFLVAIAAGTVLLALPGMSGGNVGLLESFFTATSAVCVTGLVVVDTGADFTTAGQAVILTLIQVGGLGIMTLSVFVLVLVGQKVPLGSENAVKQGFTAVAGWRIGRLLAAVLAVTVAIEALGAGILHAAGARDWWDATFHSVSAFCNAGFSLHSTSLQGLGPAIPTVCCVLFVLGGLGFTTLLEIGRSVWPRRHRRRRLTLHARLVLWTSVVLWAGGTLLVWAGERGSLGHAAFLSASARTAGFDTTPVGALSGASQLALLPLMFIGASPGSTGGGIKTVTFAVAYLVARSALRGYESVRVAGRTIPKDLIRRMFAVVVWSFIVVFAAIFLLDVFEGDHEERLLGLGFEVVSAFGTVGLSTGITAKLSVASKILLCIVMFIGRVGTISLFVLLVGRKATSRVHYPEERVLIG